jgi:predicted ATPase/class 3 adenylate cyclase
VALPTGTITFLFTDVAGSTRLWEEHPAAMRQALARHDSLAASVIELHGGALVRSRGEGDSLFAVFSRASDAVACACALQRAFVAEPWPPGAPLRVRMALHTGEADLRDGDYYGSAVNRCARLRAIAHGGQVLLSGVTQGLAGAALPAGASLRDLRVHRLGDLERPEHAFQLLHADLPAEFPPPRSLDTLPNNLPRQLTSFVGREKQIAEVKRLLAGTCLLTLTGSGGCGKTRLSLQVAADLLEGYPDGVWLAELAPLSDPVVVPQAVASALGVHEEPGRSLLQTLMDYVKSKSLLLVLDNCEHLLPACAPVADALLRACPNLRILATSRERLGVAGEQTYRVPSLTLPDPGQLPPAESLDQFEAVRLFVERAFASAPNFTVTGANAPAVAQVCRRLDGIPLAIELAAARVRVLPVEQISERLHDRFRLLTGGSRTVMPRHQTLRALIDWSYDLLTESEKALLRRLSVFAGGWSLDAAEGVCAGDGIEPAEVLDLLVSLVDKSLVVYEEPGIHEPHGGQARYRLLETVRQYGQEKLTEAGEAGSVRGRHLDRFLWLAERADARIWSEDGLLWMDRLEAEHDNLRAALDYSREIGGDGREAGMRLAGALAEFWYMRGHWTEGREWLEGMLREGHGEASAGRAKALFGAGILAWNQGDHRRARPLLEESLSLCRQSGDEQSCADTVFVLGCVLGTQGEYGEARKLLEESLGLYRRTGSRRGAVFSLAYLGRIALEQGDGAAARAVSEECLALSREVGNVWGVAFALLTLGSVAAGEGDLARAAAQCRESLAVSRESGNKRGTARCELVLGLIACRRGRLAEAGRSLRECLGVFQKLGDKEGLCSALEGVAQLCALSGRADRAVRLLAAAQARRGAIGIPLPPAGRSAEESWLAIARPALGEEAFAAARAEGWSMPLEQAIDYALQRADDPQTP